MSNSAIIQHLADKMELAAFRAYCESADDDSRYEGVERLSVEKLAPFRAALRTLVRDLESVE